MFRDEQRDTVWSEVRQHDLRSFSDQVTPEVFAKAAERAGVSLGSSALNLSNLAWLGISAAIHHAFAFAMVLTTTLRLLEDQQGFSSTSIGKAKEKGQKKKAKQAKCRRKKSKYDPRRADPTELTEEAFAQARQRMPIGFWIALILLLAEKFQQDHGRHLHIHGFRLLALDGTTWVLENWKALRDHYGTPKNGARKKKGCAPQARMVMLTFPTVRMPLAYEVAPLSISEQTLAPRLVGYLQPNDLVLIDRGFFSYGLFWQIQNRGAYFGIRLKKDVKFKTSKYFSRKDRLVEWTPKDSRRKWKKQGLLPSMRLRVIDYQIKGFRPSAIVTNVLDPKQISRDDWVRLAEDCHENGKLTPGLYHRRWEIETTYSELKVAMNAKFRSRTPASLEYEIAGRVVYYLLIRWLIVKAAEKHKLDPLRVSFSGALQELEQMRPSLTTSSLLWVTKVLLTRLIDRIAQHIVPYRPGRHYPRPNDTKTKDKGYGQVQRPAKLKSMNTKKIRKSNSSTDKYSETSKA